MTWKGKGYECEPADMDHDITQWGDASSSFSTASTAAATQASSPPTFGSHFSGVSKAYLEQAKAVDSHYAKGAKEVAKIAGIISGNKAQYQRDQATAASNVTNAGKGGGGGAGGGQGGDHPHGRKHKLSDWDPEDKDGKGKPEEPKNPNDPKDDSAYDRLEQLVDRMLEQDGTRLNAFGTDDAFDHTQETVVAYTDKDGTVHVISTNEGQGQHARSMTISFIDENGKMHVVTSIDGRLVEQTPGDSAPSERRVVMQGTLDQMMAEAKDVNIAWTDDAGNEHVVSTDGQMEQVVVGYADENGQQHMITNEKGADFAEDHPSQPRLHVALEAEPPITVHGPTDQFDQLRPPLLGTTTQA